jgi:hypothetical protein
MAATPTLGPHRRSGHIDVSADTSIVVFEGVGASRCQVAHLLDVAIWVQSDADGARRRGVRRDMVDQGIDETVALQHWDDWAAEEVPFLLQDRPWERADVIAATAPVLAHDPQTEVVLAPPSRSGYIRPPAVALTVGSNELGPDLRWATATTTRTTRSQSQ